MLDMLDDYKEAMARKEGGGVARKESEEDPDPSPAPVSERPGITGVAKSQPKKRAPAKKEPTAKKGSVAKKHNNKPNKPVKLCPGVVMHEIAGGRRKGRAIVYEAGHGPDSWAAPTPTSLKVSWFHLARALARSRAHAH
jgi:hypothetical protein